MVRKGTDVLVVTAGQLVKDALDAAAELEKEGVYGKLHPYFYTTTGTGTAVAFAEKFGREIGEELKKAGVDAAILTST